MRTILKNFSAAAILTATTLPLPVVGSPSQSATAAPYEMPSEATVKKAKEWFHRFQTGDIDRSQLEARVNAELSDAKVHSEAEKLKELGEPKSFTFLRSYSLETTIAYHFALQFASERLVEVLAFDLDGKIAAINFCKCAYSRLIRPAALRC